MMTEIANASQRPGPSVGGWISAISAAWLLSIGFDFFLHGGLLARFYAVPSPFLLSPTDAFRRIPLGYLAFFGLTAALSWLLRRLEVRGAGRGCRYGLAAGAVVWGALLVGLYSITTASASLLAGWWVGQTIELGLAGAVLGAFVAAAPMKRVWWLVAAAVIAFVGATVVLQSLGAAAAVRTTH